MKTYLTICVLLIANIFYGQIIISGDTCSYPTVYDHSYENYTFGNHGYGYRVFMDDAQVFFKEVIYDYIRATDIQFLGDTVGFLSEIPGGVYKTTNGGSYWSPFSFQGDVNWNNDDYNAMYFINAEVGYFACYAMPDVISLHKLELQSDKSLFSMNYDNLSHYYNLTDSVYLNSYCSESLNHLLFTWLINDDTIVVDLSFVNLYTNISDQGNTEINYYPNPSTGNIFIKNPDPKSEYSVSDMNGTRVKSGNLGSSNEINIEALPGGVYILRLLTDKQIKTCKFVKN